MNVSDEKYDAIASEILKAAGKFKCPVCFQNDHFNFAPNEFVVLSGERGVNGDLQLGGNSTVLRVMAATCPKCGYISFFNLVRIEENMKRK